MPKTALRASTSPDVDFAYGPLSHAGPKRESEGFGAIPWTGWKHRSESARAVRWIETYCVVPHGHGAGRPVRLAGFQKRLLRELLDRDVTAALVSIPRGNAKTTLSAMLALYFLMGRGTLSAQVTVVSGTKELARHAFVTATRMCELSPVLADLVRYFSSDDVLVMPSTGSRLMPLVGKPASIQGYGPDLAVVDECGFVRGEVWEAMVGASGKRPGSLVLGIGTPGYDATGWMFALRERARTEDLPGFRFLEWAAADGCDADDREAWRRANPAIRAGFLEEQAMATARATMPEESFRTFRLGQWVGRAGSWLPAGMWQGLRVLPPPPDGAPVWLGFDGSASGDSTALVGATPDQVWLIGCWENPGDPRWRVPRSDVTEAVARAFERWDVQELVCDPWGWRSEIQGWQGVWPGRVREWPTNLVSRMGPASDRFYAACADGRLAHDGSEPLARHVGNAVAEHTSAGAVVRKDAKNSTRKIDAAIAAIVAFEAAALPAAALDVPAIW